MIYASLFILMMATVLLGVALWNIASWPGIRARGRATRAGAVSILIPARDEEANIAACLDAALRQGETVAEVIVYDDNSTDRTSDIVSEYERKDARVRMLAPVALPEGWCGKNFACARLAEAGRGEWLLFIDADARLHDDVSARMLEEAERRRVTLLSCWPALELVSFWEKALMPMLNFVVFTLYPAPLSFKRDDPSLGIAHGACLLAHRPTYELTGGHEAVRDQINEDIRLARMWRDRGQAALCFDGRGIVSVRMYSSFAEIWRGFQKNFFPAFRRERSFWGFIALHFLVLLLPFALAPLALITGAAWGFVATAACVLATRAALDARFKHPKWSALLHPLGEILLLALGLSSWLRCKNGRGVEWKGRRYRERAAASESR